MSHTFAPVNDAHEQDLEARVRRFLTERHASALGRVTVHVSADSVLLRGVVATYSAKQMAQECAGRVAGVRHVRNAVEVALPTVASRHRSPATSTVANRAGVLLALALLAFVGCSSAVDDRVPVFPVEGTVSFGDKPLEGALIVLHPKSGSDPKILPARGYVDAAGKFTATTYESGDGAAEGEYSVTVVHTPLVQHDGDTLAGPNVLPPKYATPTTTDLTARITARPNTLPVLELKR